MATTSIWRVKGWLGKVVVYVENPDKTTNPKFFTDKDMAEQDGQELSDVIRYAVNSRKTQKADNEDCAVVHRFVSGINCSPSTARDEMLAVKKRFGKESGTVAYHGYQSFAPGEATPEMAHEIGMKLAARLWGDRYQVIVATHLDKENHLHNHFVLNTVSFVDGIKYHRTKKDYHDMQTVSDELCREYRLSVIENPQYGKAKQYGEWRAEQEQPLGRRVMGLDVVDRGQRRGVHLVARSPDAQRVEFMEVVRDAFRRVVRQERVADPLFLESVQEGLRVGEQRHPHVDRAVHVERHVADAAQAFHQFGVLPDGAVLVKGFVFHVVICSFCRCGVV